ncbi:MAG: hypothetical protein LRY51_07080 [Geovibrio sp.]|nr:hypothetical protein [Geovibrio sp.]
MNIAIALNGINLITEASVFSFLSVFIALPNQKISKTGYQKNTTNTFQVLAVVQTSENNSPLKTVSLYQRNADER